MAIVSSYIPSFIRSALENNRPVQMTFINSSETNIQSTSSFAYDPLDAPLKSTQQLNVDWSRFENHTFFSSAETKVNVAFDQIINGFPFDGKRPEIEGFLEKLTGFEKYIFDQFPRFKGQLMFSGTLVGEDTDGTSGTWISVQDSAGALYPEISRKKSGTSVLSPGADKSLTVEMQIYVPMDNLVSYQTVVQKTSETDPSKGFGFYLFDETSSTVESCFFVSSGSNSLIASATLQRGVFNHVCATLNRENDVHSADLYVNEVLVDSTTHKTFIGDMGIDSAPLLIGTGSSVKLTLNTGGPLSTFVMTPQVTFSGSLDEFRIFHGIRTLEQQKAYATKSVYSTDDLRLYYRFNEPPVQLGLTSSDAVNSIVLDSSGNSLHSTVNNFFDYIDTDINGTITGCVLRQNASLDPLSKMVNERYDMSIVLFPTHPDIKSLNSDLLLSASSYDADNPNTISKLIPKHYLLEGQTYDGFSSEEGTIGQPYGTTSGMPGQGQLGSAQLILTLLYTWAKFFDEMKLYVDSFSTIKTVDYQKNDSVPDNFLINGINQLGFHLPPMFNDSTIQQYVDGENITDEISTSTYALKHVQSELLRRALINMPNIIKSKGTQHSIKSFLRSVGIDPDNSLRIREYGGPTTKQLSFSREKKRETNYMAQFATGSVAISPFLSSSRVEVGYPYPSGTFVNKEVFHPHGISNVRNDGILTSGSWTYEAIYKYTPEIMADMQPTQSLARMFVSSSTLTADPFLIANLLAISSSVDPRLELYLRPGRETTADYLKLELPIPNGGFFDSNRWNVSFGRIKGDSFGSVSSSYFLRLSTQNDGEITHYSSTSSFLFDEPKNAFSYGDSGVGEKGPFIVVGQNQNSISTTYSYFLNASSIPSESRALDFTGRISNLRFWSKGLTEDEWKEHVKNYKSAGVTNPLTNWNFEKTASGSFERLRLETFTKQETRRADEFGSINFLDFSLNNNHFSGSGFPINSDTLKGEIFDYSYLSPYYDEASTSEKVRVRGYLSQDLVDATPWAQVAPVHEVMKSEEPTDDVRMSIEFSLVDALNRDIVNMFASFDVLDNALGAPELAYSPDYPDLEKLRNVYFNRISEKLNFKAFFEFFRWFDTSIGTFIEQLVPRKTKFKGTNFTIESHMLERHKLEYHSSEQYLMPSDRNRIRDVLLVQQIVGNVRKY